MVKATHTQLTLSDVDNDAVARQLDEIAARLAEQGANPFRITAYRNAAATLRDLNRPVREILDAQGLDALLALPGIGPSIARAIQRFVQTGKVPRLEQLRSSSDPPRIFTTVAQIGPRLAADIHSDLGIETLADLEAAAWDGRLAKVPGMGRKRIQAVREALAGRFHRPSSPPRQAQQTRPADEPPVAELLSIDEEYRRLVELDRLPRIAPRRFNPQGIAWLPILRTQRGGHHFTALFSNTARAHELGTSHDWVVIYSDDSLDHGQWTIVTARFGTLKDRRTVRGREQECMEHYRMAARL